MSPRTSTRGSFSLLHRFVQKRCTKRTRKIVYRTIAKGIEMAGVCAPRRVLCIANDTSGSRGIGSLVRIIHVHCRLGHRPRRTVLCLHLGKTSLHHIERPRPRTSAFIHAIAVSSNAAKRTPLRDEIRDGVHGCFLFRSDRYHAHGEQIFSSPSRARS